MLSEISQSHGSKYVFFWHLWKLGGNKNELMKIKRGPLRSGRG
jgi:hypothetical protein